MKLTKTLYCGNCEVVLGWHNKKIDGGKRSISRILSSAFLKRITGERYRRDVFAVICRNCGALTNPWGGDGLLDSISEDTKNKEIKSVDLSEKDIDLIRAQAYKRKTPVKMPKKIMNLIKSLELANKLDKEDK